MRQSVLDKLRGLGACYDALRWVSEQKTVDQAWADCKRGDHMLWLLGRLCGPPESRSRRKLVLAACACARLRLVDLPKADDVALSTIETTESWARGERGVSLDDVRDAARAATHTAACTVNAADAAYPAAPAAYAAYVAAYAAYAAHAAADAADAAHAAADAARQLILSRCADVVRSAYPHPPRL